MKKSLPLPELLPALVSIIVFLTACGGDEGGDDTGAAGVEAPTSSQSWTLAPEELCSLLTGEELSKALGITVTAEANDFDGCLYGGDEVLARLTESPLSDAEYPSFVLDLGARDIEVGDAAIMATNGEGDILGAWFSHGEQAFEMLFTTEVSPEQCTEIVAATRAEG